MAASGVVASFGDQQSGAVVMVVVYVRIQASLARSASLSKRIYALLLPDGETGEWAEVNVRASALGGFGVFPVKHNRGQLDWSNVSNVPVLMVCIARRTLLAGL